MIELRRPTIGAMQPHDMREDGGEYVCVDCSY